MSDEIKIDLLMDEAFSPEGSKKSNLKDVLKNYSFLLMQFGYFIEILGSSSVVIALMFLIYSTSQSPALIGLFQTVTMIPAVVLAPFAGVLVDRMDQRKIMMLSMLVRVVTAIGLALVYIFRNKLIFSVALNIVNPGESGNGELQNNSLFLALLFIIFILRVSIWPFFNPAKGAYTKLIVEEKNLLTANSFASTTSQIAGVLGPIISGVLVAIGYTIGFIFAIGTSSLAFIIFIFLSIFGRKPPSKNNETNHIKTKSRTVEAINELKIGMKTIRQEPKILYLILLLGIVSFTVAGIDVMWPVILQGEMNLNSTWYGAMESVVSACAIIASLVIMIVGKIDRKVVMMTSLLALEGTIIILMGYIRLPWVMIFAVMVPYGIVYGIFGITLETIIQEKVDYEKQGRVFSAQSFLSSLTLLIGLVIVTSIAEFVQPSIVLYVCGSLELLTVLGGFIFIWRKKLFTTDYVKIKN
ncbi:MAG TPA: MFS transporter [candidate division Zixibacteria bacterium]|nr:MFS transporter [candidate division Zixibacteria bacterium]